jgi:multicomponent Na+:H+ antiporter subunit F
MTLEWPIVLKTAAGGGLSVLVLSMALTVVRLARGPVSADRIVALDLLSVLIVGFVALYAVFSRQAAYLDVAAAYALVAFLGTVAFARFMERSAAAQRRKREKATLLEVDRE